MKASRKPNWKSTTAGNPAKGQNGEGQRGGGIGGYFPGHGRSGSRGEFGGRRGSYGGRGYVPNRGRGGNRGRGLNTAGSFDSQACYVCGKRGYLARDCMQAGNMTGGASSSVARTQQSVQRGTRRGRGNSRRVRFSGFNVVHDEEGYDYPVDDEGRIYIPLDSQTFSGTEHLETSEKETKT